MCTWWETTMTTQNTPIREFQLHAKLRWDAVPLKEIRDSEPASTLTCLPSTGSLWIITFTSLQGSKTKGMGNSNSSSSRTPPRITSLSWKYRTTLNLTSHWIFIWTETRWFSRTTRVPTRPQRRHPQIMPTWIAQPRVRYPRSYSTFCLEITIGQLPTATEQNKAVKVATSPYQSGTGVWARTVWKRSEWMWASKSNWRLYLRQKDFRFNKNSQIKSNTWKKFSMMIQN